MIPLIIVFALVSTSSAVPLEKFFPFGPGANDSSLRSNTTETYDCIDLPSIFPYFDGNHRNVCITSNGVINFDLERSIFAQPANLSVADYSYLLAGFWFEENMTRNFDVFYQLYSWNTSSNIADRITRSIRAFFPEQPPFNPSLAIIATWNGSNSSFQIVLSTDGNRAFAFLLYHQMEQFQHINGTAYPRIGFVGDGNQTARELSFSGTAHFPRLINGSNVNAPGLFVFRVDTEQVNDGGCEENGTRVSVRSRRGSLFGSTALIITGPCFKDTTKVTCHFGSTASVNGIAVDQYRVICLTPFASKRETVQLSISIDDAQRNLSGPAFTYTPMLFGSHDVQLQTTSQTEFLAANENITLKWNFPEYVAATFPNGTLINIDFWPIKNDGSENVFKDSQPISLVRNRTISTSHTLILPPTIVNHSVGFIQVTARFNGKTYAGLNTGLLVIRSSASAAKQFCRTWDTEQVSSSRWNGDGLLQCPMNRWQAIAGGFCCYQRDPHCSKDRSVAKNCWLHQGRSKWNETSAVECYQSIASNRHGAGAECCYGNDSVLITRGTGAGTDNRYHPIQYPIQHFFHDTLPYMQCCLLSDDDDLCDSYLIHRPSRPGSNTMGDTGRMWGDPHFGTLDGSHYTFNGYGEYVYLALSNSASPSNQFNDSDPSLIFLSQIRTKPLNFENATITTAFAAQLTNGREIIRLTISSRQQIVLTREREILQFEDNDDQLVFPEMTITRIKDDYNGHFILTWSIGVSFEIKVINITKPSFTLLLDIAAAVSTQYRRKTYGLLGTYDGNATNDLRNRDGITLPQNATEEEIYNRFGKSWSISPNTSLFLYESGEKAEDFQKHNQEHKPKFFKSSEILARNKTLEICNISRTVQIEHWTPAQRTCAFDHLITDDERLARSSRRAGDDFERVKTYQESAPVFIESLPLNMTFTVGDKVTLNFSATHEQKKPVILTALHLPPNATFNTTTGLFVWNATVGKEYVSIQAKTNDPILTNKHEITFNVLPKPTTSAVNRLSMTVISPLFLLSLMYRLA